MLKVCGKEFLTSLQRSSSSGSVRQLLLIITTSVFCDAEEESALRSLQQLMDNRVLPVCLILDNSVEHGGCPVLERLDGCHYQKRGLVQHLTVMPFSYYLVVRSLADFPMVLSDALRQWLTLL